MKITYGTHALDVLAERGIAREWVERTLAAPESTEPDPHHSDRTRAYRKLPERDGRVLRVVCISITEGAHVVTAFLLDPLGSRPPETSAMQSRYDPDTDALHVRFAETEVAESEEVRPGIVLDYDAAGRVVAVEIIDASTHLSPGADLRHLTAA